MDTTQYFHLIKDTIQIALNAPISSTQVISGDSTGYRLLYTAIATLIGSAIGTLAILWYKKQEFQNFQENLDLQKQLFEETKKNNENQLKAELVRLRDLRKQYELSLKKNDFDHLNRVLDFADDGNEKAKMLKKYALELQRFTPIIPDYVQEYFEYQEYVVSHIYINLDQIEESMKNLLIDFPNVFVLLHPDIKNIANDAGYLKRFKAEFLSHHEDVDEDSIVIKLFDSLFDVSEKMNQLLENMKEEFSDLARLKRNFIKNQIDGSHS